MCIYGVWGFILARNIEMNKQPPFNDFVKCLGHLLEEIQYLDLVKCRSL